MFFAVTQVSASGAAVGTPSYTAKQANQIIANETAYVSLVNESGFLLFSPNLTQAYSYINRSAEAYNKSPSEAVHYALMAGASAKDAYSRISTNKAYYALIMAVMAGMSGFLLYIYARKVQYPKNKRGNNSGR